ncbi:uncharacterized protein [Eucyclogobius newberryi]|uniref:uncharacterized protein n=1 Tax=Eucyclogobius newberryi TaxID=166745 RepID=UPI003B596E0D
MEFGDTMFGAVTFVALFFTMSCQTHSDHLPPPANLSSEWMDNLKVKVSWSWTKPKDLDCHVLFDWKVNGQTRAQTIDTHFLDEPLTESSDKWIYSVRTVPISCMNMKSSVEAEIVVEAPKPIAKMTDFKCYLSISHMDCSWTQDPNLSVLYLSYRECGQTVSEQSKKCVPQTNLKGPRTVCRLEGNFLQKDLCIVAFTQNGTSTFKAPKALRLPKKMKISEEGTNLVLMSMPLEVEISSSFYNICYSVCDKPRASTF